MPPHAAMLLALAARHLRAGRAADAIAPLSEAAQLAPGDATIQHDLGLACLECGRLDDAIASLQAAIRLKPHYADAHLRLGIALEAAGAAEPALAAYRRASDILPSLADARYRAGDLLEKRGRTDEAAAAYRRAAAAAPKTTLGRIAAAKALLAEDRDAEAEKILRRALALDKDNAVALELLANLLADAGRFDAARDTFLRAIERAPRRAGSFYDVVRCRRIRAEDAPLLERMRAALAQPGLEPLTRARIHLALGKAADDLGEYQAAMQHFDAAEALRNATVRFDPAAFDARVDRLIAAFPRAVMPLAQAAHAATGPILIVGLPRSGTTLAEQIISAHPAVRAAGELPFWNERGHLWERAGSGVPAHTFLEEASVDYLRLLARIAPQGARVTDKNPLNFLFAGLIHLALPHAAIIHCRRALIDTALSIHQTHFNPLMDFPTGGPALVAYMRAYRRLTAHWRAVLPADRFIEVEYEALTRDPATAIRRMIAGAGLPWDDACLRPEHNARVVKTPSKWQARQPIYAGSAGRWRAYEPFLGPLRALLDED